MFKMFYHIGAIFIIIALTSCSNSVQQGAQDFDLIDDGENTDTLLDGDESVDDDATNHPLITNIAVEPNQNSVISCIVSWETDIDSNATVKFFAEDTPVFTISSDKTGTKHRVVVVGMKQNKTYTLTAISGETEDTAGTFTTKPLPPHILDNVAVVHDSEKTDDGWTLFMMISVMLDETGEIVGGNMDFPPTLLAYDMDGDVVWYSIVPDMTIGDVRYYPKRKIISASTTRIGNFKAESAYREFNWEGNVVFDNPQQPEPVRAMDQRYHHTFQRRDNGHLWSLRHTIKDMPNGADTIPVLGDDIIEMDELGNVIWEWSIFDHETLDLSSISPTTEAVDWTHCNALELNNDDSILYLNSRHLSTFYKIEKATGNVIWRFGSNGDFTMAPTVDDPWFHYSHAAKILQNGNILVYDNGNGVRNYSRAIEYTINETDMTAQVVWQYGGPDSKMWQTFYWGDVDRLPNDNTVITAATFDKGIPSTIKEVTHEGEKVWEIIFPQQDDTKAYGIYNSVRITPPVQIVR